MSGNPKNPTNSVKNQTPISQSYIQGGDRKPYENII